MYSAFEVVRTFLVRQNVRGGGTNEVIAKAWPETMATNGEPLKAFKMSVAE